MEVLFFCIATLDILNLKGILKHWRSLGSNNPEYLLLLLLHIIENLREVNREGLGNKKFTKMGTKETYMLITFCIRYETIQLATYSLEST